MKIKFSLEDALVQRVKAQLKMNGFVKRLFYKTNLNGHLHGFVSLH